MTTYQLLFDKEGKVSKHQFVMSRWQLSRLGLTTAPHDQYLGLAVAKGGMAGKRWDNNPNFPKDKTHIPICGLYGMETLECKHS